MLTYGRSAMFGRLSYCAPFPRRRHPFVYNDRRNRDDQESKSRNDLGMMTRYGTSQRHRACRRDALLTMNHQHQGTSEGRQERQSIPQRPLTHSDQWRRCTARRPISLARKPSCRTRLRREYQSITAFREYYSRILLLPSHWV
jgi:hypothetical protein